MKKTILYPFEISPENRDTYSRTMNMAERINAKVVLLTALTNNSPSEKNEAYLHLLELNGLFQTQHNNWRATNIDSQRVVFKGNIQRGIEYYLNYQKVDYLICQPHEPSLNEDAMRKIIDRTGKTINLKA